MNYIRIVIRSIAWPASKIINKSFQSANAQHDQTTTVGKARREGLQSE
jgi:hypothetical protein